MDNPRYAEDRAKELIARAQQIDTERAATPDAVKMNKEEYHKLMGQAIGLLALARALKQ